MRDLIALPSMHDQQHTAPAILITILLSHSCEKARWALDRVALPYREEPHAPLLHRLATKRSERGTVPVLVHGSSRFSDSTDILKHVDAVCGGDLLYPRDGELRREVDALDERFDMELGPHTRRWAYGQALPQTKSIRSLWARGGAAARGERDFGDHAAGAPAGPHGVQNHAGKRAAFTRARARRFSASGRTAE
jgi:glutathione S-transferase